MNILCKYRKSLWNTVTHIGQMWCHGHLGLGALAGQLQGQHFAGAFLFEAMASATSTAEAIAQNMEQRLHNKQCRALVAVSPFGPSGLELVWKSESSGTGDLMEEGIKCFLEPQVCNRLWLLLASPWQGPAPIHPTQPPHTRGNPSVHTTMHGMNTWFASSAPCMASSPCISYGWLYRSTVCWVLALSL